MNNRSTLIIIIMLRMLTIWCTLKTLWVFFFLSYYLYLSNDLYQTKQYWHLVKTLLLTLVCCNITVRSNRVCRASSFIFSLSDKPALNGVVFKNESAVKLNKQTNSIYLNKQSVVFFPNVTPCLPVGCTGPKCPFCLLEVPPGMGFLLRGTN